ncbi:anti-sigma factor family protein [Niallia sp. 03133]|uniref:anti-sigma factor family protein n=1 Tax=Niallia sp. 03133 TaxID=3458060 RepID=UPI004044E6CA
MTTHYSFEQWLKYVNDELVEKERIHLEDHLYTCDQCLDLYVNAVAEQETMLPAISDETAFTDQIMRKISNEEVETILEVKEKKKKSFYQSSIFHYTLAAAATIFLMSTGVFQSIIQHTETIQKAEIPSKKESAAVGFVDKTFSWMYELEGSKKEEKK